MSSTTGDQSKPVTGYPPGYHQAQSSNYHPTTGYPPAQPSYPYPTATGTAYPYTAPPPADYYHSNPYPPPPFAPRRNTFLRRVIIISITVFLIFVTVGFITWLILRPSLPEFRVDSVSVSRFNASSSQLAANWDVTFSVRNPNKRMNIYYDRVESFVFYRNDVLSQITLPPFSQGKKNQTKVQAGFSAVSTYVDDWTVTEMLADRSRGEVSFNVRMVSWIGFRNGVWRARRRLLRVFCEDLKVGFTSNNGAGMLLGGSRECEVD